MINTSLTILFFVSFISGRNNNKGDNEESNTLEGLWEVITLVENGNTTLLIRVNSGNTYLQVCNTSMTRLQQITTPPLLPKTKFIDF